jgi:ferrous iron transport protein B
LKNKRIKVALAGNPNTGKTTLINAIAGTNLKVGNWPGVTVEKKEAVIKYKDYTIELIDLPGIYSLGNQTAEEKVSIDFLLKEKPDLIIDVVDSTNLERNLYLTIQLLELEIPLIVALNMWDEAKEKGIEIDYKNMERLLCSKVVPTSAVHKTGVKELLEGIIQTYENKKFIQCTHFESEIEQYLIELKKTIEKVQPILLDLVPKRFLIISLIEGNFDYEDIEINGKILEKAEEIRKKLEKIYKKDISTLLIEERYSIVISIYEQCVKKDTLKEIDTTLILDKIFLNKVVGLPIFLFLAWLMFEFTFELSAPYVDWLDSSLSNVIAVWAVQGLTSLNAPEWLQSLVAEGVIGGVGFVLVFVPVLFFLYIFMGILEGSGYMARAAFLMDRFMSFVGLSGKSFIPLIIGFGCNVPAVYATRTIENPKEKILTALMIPFMSCGARLTVYAFFVTAFFTHHKALVILSLYLLGILVAISVAFLLQRTYFKTESQNFILELPPYRLPTFRYILISAWAKTKAFIIDAGTFIFATAVIVWFLLNIPFGVQNKENSLFGHISKAIAPVFQPLGFGYWEASGALITGFVAKEVVLSTMGNIYAGETLKEEKQKHVSLGEGLKEIGTGFINANLEVGKIVLSGFGLIKSEVEEEETDSTLLNAVRQQFTPLSAYAFLVFLLLYTPCMATIFAIKQELNSWKWMGISVAIGLTVAWILSFLVYHIGKLIV